MNPSLAWHVILTSVWKGMGADEELLEKEIYKNIGDRTKFDAFQGPWIPSKTRMRPAFITNVIMCIKIM